MIEIEKDRIRLTTVDTREAQLPNSRAVPPAPSCVVLAGGRDLACTIAFVPSLRVHTLALEADPLTGLLRKRSKGKVSEWLDLGAHPTNASLDRRSDEQLSG